MSAAATAEAGPCALAAEIRAIGAPLGELVGGLDPREVPACWAPEVMAAFAEVARWAESGRVLMAARAAEAGEWERRRFPSPADWLAQELGTSAGRARAELEMSGQLAGLDATADAVRAGELSVEQAGAVADAASVNPRAEGDLLDAARRESLRRLKQEAERRKAEVRSEEERAARDRRVRRERGARFWFANGAGHLEAKGPIAAMKDLEARLGRELDRRFRSMAPEERARLRGESRANRMFDALVGLGENEHERVAGDGDVEPGDGAGSGGMRRSKRKAQPSVRRLVMVRVDLAALMRGSAEPGELCEIGGVPVSVGELRKLLGESILQLVLTNGEAVVDVVSLHRRPTIAQAVAKLFAGAECSVVGCDRAVRLELDHRIDWAKVLVTELKSLDLLCDHHHDLKTYEGWRLVDGTGRRAMAPPGEPPGEQPRRRGPERESTSPSPPPPPPPPPSRAAGALVASRYRDGTAPPPTDLVARLGAIRSREAEHQARRAGQDQLFDTG